MHIRKLTMAAAAVGALAAAGPVAGASAAITPAAIPTTTTPSGQLIFVPPHVGPICVTIGATIIGGHVMDPGIHNCTTGTSLPSFTMPGFPLATFPLPSVSLPAVN